MHAVLAREARSLDWAPSVDAMALHRPNHQAPCRRSRSPCSASLADQPDSERRVPCVLTALRMWSLRRWLAALVATVITVLVMALPAALIPNPVFGREIPPTPWAWPVLLITAALSGLLFATYIRQPIEQAHRSGGTRPDVTSRPTVDRRGALGALLTFFAIGCPVCNKIALVALGYSGALQWFAPLQPWLAAVAVVLLAWALARRLRGQVACPVAPAPG